MPSDLKAARHFAEKSIDSVGPNMVQKNPDSPENERMSPENQWLVQMYSLFKKVPLKRGHVSFVFWGVFFWKPAGKLKMHRFSPGFGTLTEFCLNPKGPKGCQPRIPPGNLRFGLEGWKLSHLAIKNR